MNILAFDPGLTVGWSEFTDSPGWYFVLECGHAMSLEDVVDLIQQKNPSLIVYEGFARGNSVVDEQLKTIEMCGAIKAIAHNQGIPVVMQYPAARKGYVPIAKQMVKSKGYTLEEMHHAIDAIAHGLCYIDKEGMEWQKQFWLHKAFQ